VSIGLIICTLVVYGQIRFARTVDAGFRKEGLIQLANLDRAVVVPLVDCLIGLSAWPNLISSHAFGGGHATHTVHTTLVAAPENK